MFTDFNKRDLKPNLHEKLQIYLNIKNAGFNQVLR